MPRRTAVSVDDVFDTAVKETKPQGTMSLRRQDDVEKLTVYLPADLRTQLDLTRAQLRAEHGVKTTYSEIVTVAVSEALTDTEKLASLLACH